jgi:peroxiredoxin
MALLESANISPNTIMPSFYLSDPWQKKYSLDDVMGEKGLIIYFTCNHCPYAIGIWDRSIKLATKFKPQGVNTIAINPNIHPHYPEDSVDAMKTKIKTDAITFPYLVDETQNIAKAYKAQCTPDIYVLRADKTLFYHGRLDDNWQNEAAVSSHDLNNAVTNLVENKEVTNTQFPSMGCSIKWQA